MKNATKAKVLFNLDLKSKSGRKIESGMFKNKECTDIDAVIDLEKALHQVGYGTGREEAFADAIVLEEIPGEYVFSFESDGSLSPEEIFNKACEELVARFEKISGEIDGALA